MSLVSTFKLFATKAEGKEATSKDITRWLTDAGAIGKSCSSNNLDIAFSKLSFPVSTVTSSQIVALVAELAKAYKTDKKIADIEEATAKLTSVLSEAKPKGHGTTKTSKTGGVGKMTDASNYTGSHKERFDADGKGKGLDGRKDLHDNSGYVGNYKGDKTYDDK